MGMELVPRALLHTPNISSATRLYAQPQITALVRLFSVGNCFKKLKILNAAFGLISMFDVMD